MASNSGINELMEAEKQASEIVKEARAARVSQMKLAKVEAEKEIGTYRDEQQRAFDAANSQADDSEEAKRLEQSAEADIAQMGTDFAAGKEAVVDLMLGLASSVEYSVPDARKNKKK
eukprot:g1951.t1